MPDGRQRLTTVKVIPAGEPTPKSTPGVVTPAPKNDAVPPAVSPGLGSSEDDEEDSDDE